MTLHIYKGFRFEDREVVGRHFDDFAVEQNGMTQILTGAEIRHAVHDETGKFYDTIEYDEEDEFDEEV